MAPMPHMVMTAMASSRPGVQERIFLHLRDFVDHKEKVEVPFAISQMGIANSVSIICHYIHKAISNNKN